MRVNRSRSVVLVLLVSICCVLITITIYTKDVDVNSYKQVVVEKLRVVEAYSCGKQRAPATLPRIPKIIHQVWNTDILPAEFIGHVKSLVRDNPFPEWEYYFWTKTSGAKLLKDKYPYLLQRFNNETATSNTMRADIIRIVAIHEYGGVYFDLDTMSVRTLSGFVNNHDCSVSQEPGEHKLGMKWDFLITNAALLCRPKHPFFKHLLLRLATLPDNCHNAFECTGPGMLTPLILQISRTNGDTIELPEVHQSYLFQDTYDSISLPREKVAMFCSSGKLSKKRIEMCREWAERGYENRTLSYLAYTYHTWFHVYNKQLEESPTNYIFNIVPHAKVYGRNL